MTNTPRMRWPIPTENLDPWFDAFTEMMNEVDSSAYAYLEDRNTICMTGGTFTWNAETSVLAWSGTIELLAANTGFLWQIVSGNLTIADGQVFYVTLVRAPANTVQVSAVAANNLSAVSDPDSAMVICVRRGSFLYFRNGRVMGDGDNFSVFESNSVPSAYALPDRWAQSAIAASQTNVALGSLISTHFNQVQAVRAGSIVGISTRLTGSVTGGTLTAKVTIGGVGGTLALAHTSSSNPTGGVATQAVGIDTFAAGSLIGVEITTTSGFTPTGSLTLEVWLEIAETES